MKHIQTVGVIGLGALGTLYAWELTQALGKDRVLVLADPARIRRYTQEGIWFNGERCDFHYADPAALTEPVDLLLFATKFTGLDAAVESCRPLVGPETTLVSVLNGVSSEQVLSQAFSPAQVVWCVAERMSAKKEGNRVEVEPLGRLAIGMPEGQDPTHLDRLCAFFEEAAFPYHRNPDIRTHMWSKLLCNTGANQTAMVYQCGYGGLQTPGPIRDTMLGAMREVVLVANAEGIALSEEDVASWTAIIDSFPADGEPSMRQDGKAHRKTEVELFAGTIRRLAAQHGLSVPVNDRLYEQVQAMEREF